MAISAQTERISGRWIRRYYDRAAGRGPWLLDDDSAMWHLRLPTKSQGDLSHWAWPHDQHERLVDALARLAAGDEGEQLLPGGAKGAWGRDGQLHVRGPIGFSFALPGALVCILHADLLALAQGAEWNELASGSRLLLSPAGHETLRESLGRARRP